MGRMARRYGHVGDDAKGAAVEILDRGGQKIGRNSPQPKIPPFLTCCERPDT